MDIKTMKYIDHELDEILGLEGLEDPEICKVCNRPLANWYTDCYHEHGDFRAYIDWRAES